MVKIKQGRGCSLARVPVNSSGDVAAQVLNAGVVPRDGDGDGDVDDVQTATASSNA
jgi:hypothetical protein